MLAALNGVLGDHLAATRNPLATVMSVRRDGAELPLQPQALAAALPQATGRVLLTVHGLCMNDRQWQRGGADHGVDGEARVPGGQLVRGRAQRRRADVERNVASEAPRRVERVEQHPGLVRRPRPQFHERVGAGQLGDLGGRTTERRPLSLGRVVLDEAGDLVEELAAGLVVEPLGGKGFRRLRKTGADVVAQRPVCRIGAEVVGQLHRHHRRSSGIRCMPWAFTSTR